jgi:hypothetical protein
VVIAAVILEDVRTAPRSAPGNVADVGPLDAFVKVRGADPAPAGPNKRSNVNKRHRASRRLFCPAIPGKTPIKRPNDAAVAQSVMTARNDGKLAGPATAARKWLPFNPAALPGRAGSAPARQASARHDGFLPGSIPDRPWQEWRYHGHDV